MEVPEYKLKPAAPFLATEKPPGQVNGTGGVIGISVGLDLVGECLCYGCPANHDFDVFEPGFDQTLDDGFHIDHG